MSDDDLDNLLDDALQEYDVKEKEADLAAAKAAADRAHSARVLNDALHSTGGENHLAKPGDGLGGMMPPGMENPEQLRQMMTQLTAILTQTQQLDSADPNSPESMQQEEKLLEMAKQLIMNAQSNVEDEEEKAKIDSTMKALQRVQEITKNGGGANAKDDPTVSEELQKISEALQGHVQTSRSKVPGLNEAFSAAAAAANANNNNGGENNNQQQQQPPFASEQDRLQFESIMKQMQASIGAQQQQNGGGGGGGGEDNQLSSEQQAALFAMLSAMQQQQPATQGQTESGQQQQQAAAGLAGYYNLIFAKFASIDQQYDAFFDGRGKEELEAGKLTQSDFDRFKQQHAVVKQLLVFKDKQQEMLEKAVAANTNGEQGDDDNNDPDVNELNCIVEKLRSLGDPPSGFDV